MELFPTVEEKAALAGNVVVLIYSWMSGTLSPPAVLVAAVLSGVNALHQWSGFYSTFVMILSVFVLSRMTSEQSKRRSSRPILSALTFATLLISLHAFYLSNRLAAVPSYHLRRLPQGCLAIPSRTLKKTYHNTLLDSLANQLPYGIAISHSMTMASVVSSAFGATGTPKRLLCSLIGAVLPALDLACLLPMCTAGLDGADELVSHIDRRSKMWGERESVFWSPEARYGAFVLAIAFNGAMGSAVKLTRSELGSNLLVTGSLVLAMGLWTVNGNSWEGGPN